MIAIGPSLRRKSFNKVEPILPRPTNHREPSTKGRTTYKQLRLPSEQLKDFQKRELFTMGTLSTEKSSILHSSEQNNMKQSRYDYDHHNTDSIAQLFQAKNDSNVPSLLHTKRSTSMPKSSVEGLSDQKRSIESEGITNKQEGGQQIQKEDDVQGKEGQNYDDYVLGDKIDEEEAEEREDKTIKKYASDHSTKVLGRYICNSESQLRMQRQMILSEARKLAQINEDREIAAIMQQYKNNKQKILSQSTKKHQTARILASLHHNNKIQKSSSLPVLKPKQELIVPQEYYQERPEEPWKNTKNLLATALQKPTEQIQKLKYTLSYGKLGFGKKKIRTICQQQILEEQMISLEEIKQKLRSKGVKFDANKLKKGLINLKNEPYQYKNLQYPQKKLPSNPIYKKFPL